MHLRHVVAPLLVLAPLAAARAQVDARMLRYPDVSATQIAFVYAGDIWIVPKTGGTASRLSSPRGEEQFPRFSPDGSQIAYSANYDGNIDVYVVPAAGGVPTRVTYHPGADRLVDWAPDGRRLLFASGRESGRQRYSQFYLVSASGGMPAKEPIPYGEFGALSADGRYVAYVDKAQDFRTWKRYRGGWAPDIWLFDLRDSSATRIAPNDADDTQPMWHGNTLYFLSDRGPDLRHNIWAYDLTSKQVRQVTRFRDFDITFPASGPDDIVFQAGGRLYLLNLGNEQVTEVKVNVVTDEATVRPRSVSVERQIETAGISPTGKRAIFEARGDIFTVPAENGPVLNLSRTSGVAERYPSWSPDGTMLAYWSDRTGEYELYLRPADGTGSERKLTSLGTGFRYQAQWSPNNKKLAFADDAMRIRVYDLDAAKVTLIDSSRVYMAHGQLESMAFSWSADSRWLAYGRPAETGNGALFLYDTQAAKLTQATSGYFSDNLAAFDPEGKYLFYLSNRSFQPVYGDFDNSWTYPNSTEIVAVPLRAAVASPLAPKSDDEGGPSAKRDSATTTPAAAAPKRDSTASAAASTPVEIDLAGFESRAVVLPAKAGNYSGLSAVKGKVLYRRQPRTGSGDTTSAIAYWDLTDRKEEIVLADADAFVVSADGNKLLVRNNRRWAIVDVKAGQKMDKPLHTSEMETVVEPRAEWRQMFADAYRFERDFFYDPNMHGVDWPGLRERYGRLIDEATTRWDVNFVLGEFISELNSSHTYRGGGDEEQAPNRGVGMLGVDWSLENGAYRIKRIVHAAPWDAEARAPLDQPGVAVSEGEYLLAVNGIAVDAADDPWAAFQGLADQTVRLTVNHRPTADGARQVLVKTLGDETQLRFRAWIEERRQYVDKATGGRAGYVYVQSTGVEAQNELMRQFMGQWRKDGLIVDERWNSGGQIPDRFIELLNRPMLSYWAVRHGEDWQWPPVAHRGPKVMLINGWSGSGGDAFPFYFREAKLGPLIGTRTWGGLIGLSGSPSIVDGGQLTVPTFRMYDVRGNWFSEGHGVEPDIVVDEDPAQLARGKDTQLDRAIAVVMDEIRKNPPRPPARPGYQNRAVAADGKQPR